MKIFSQAILRNIFYCISTALLCVGVTTTHAQNYPHIKTFGYDYIRFSDKTASPGDLEWLAKKHDWIVGPKSQWPLQGVDYLGKLTYDTVKSANPNTNIMKYLPYHSVAPTYQEWMEKWCLDNGYNPEDIYYHYYRDTNIRLTNGKTILVRGYRGGGAHKLKESRLRVKWNGGWVGINPSSAVFNKAFQALALHVVTLEGSTEIYADGLLLDTFEGITDSGYWSSYLENTIELRKIGGRTSIYAKVREDLVKSKVDLESFLKRKTGKRDFRVNVNGADVDYIYNQYENLYGDFREKLMDVSIEFLITSTTSLHRIKRLQQVYEDMSHGRKFLIRSQTNYAPSNKKVPIEFTQFILASHYLINHPNAHFFYHYGGANNYGGFPYGNPKITHWHMNMEIDIGHPISRLSPDYWGEVDTNRFYTFSKERNSIVIGREYSNALVIAKYGNTGGWNNIGTNKKEYLLDGKYCRLMSNNSLSVATDRIKLGNSEGAILLKATPVNSACI